MGLEAPPLLAFFRCFGARSAELAEVRHVYPHEVGNQGMKCPTRMSFFQFMARFSNAINSPAKNDFPWVRLIN